MRDPGLPTILIIFVSAISVEYSYGQQPPVEKSRAAVATAQEDKEKPREDETGEPIERLSLDEVRQLIGQLGDKSFAERNRAHKTLFDQGEYILDRFDELANELSIASRDPEVDWRVQAIRRGLTRSPFENSMWRLTYTEKRDDLSVKEKSIIFLDDQSFDYVKKGESRERANNSAWSSASVDQITFSFNNRYAVYEGKRVSENVIEGVANNIKGKTWKWRLTFIE